MWVSFFCLSSSCFVSSTLHLLMILDLYSHLLEKIDFLQRSTNSFGTTDLENLPQLNSVQALALHPCYPMAVSHNMDRTSEYQHKFAVSLGPVCHLLPLHCPDLQSPGCMRNPIPHLHYPPLVLPHGVKHPHQLQS